MTTQPKHKRWRGWVPRHVIGTGPTEGITVPVAHVLVFETGADCDQDESLLDRVDRRMTDPEHPGENIIGLAREIDGMGLDGNLPRISAALVEVLELLRIAHGRLARAESENADLRKDRDSQRKRAEAAELAVGQIVGAPKAGAWHDDEDPWRDNAGSNRFFVRAGNEGNVQVLYAHSPQHAIFQFLGDEFGVQPGDYIFVWRSGDPRPDLPAIEAEGRSCPVGEPRVFELRIDITER